MLHYGRILSRLFIAALKSCPICCKFAQLKGQLEKGVFSQVTFRLVQNLQRKQLFRDFYASLILDRVYGKSWYEDLFDFTIDLYNVFHCRLLFSVTKVLGIIYDCSLYTVTFFRNFTQNPFSQLTQTLHFNFYLDKEIFSS